MAIERAVYGSIQKGIEDKGDGYQFYTYTHDFKNIIEENRNIKDIVFSTYKYPLIDESDKYFNNAKEGNEWRNKASELAEKEYPITFSYAPIAFGDEKRYMFVFAKDMGYDWSGQRPHAIFQVTTLCSQGDMSKAPVMYCSSPVVCCDVLREEFFPLNGNPPTPAMLRSDCTLSGQNDINVKHRAFFGNITESDVVQFISEKEDERLPILKSLATALMKLKDGEARCRIVLADSNANNLMWIAALSYIFPLKNVMEMSFTTYGYDIGSFDINGVYVSSLNDSKDDPSLGSPTRYEYNDVVSNMAVYDFERESYGNNVDVEDNIFMDMIENAFTVSMKRQLEPYKEYISKSTSYTGLDSDYIKGYFLYAFLNTNLTLSINELRDGCEFAAKYASQAECNSILGKLINDLDKFISSDETRNDVIIDFVKSLVESNKYSMSDIEKMLFDKIYTLLRENKFENWQSFCDMSSVISRICGINGDNFDVLLVEKVGVGELRRFVSVVGTDWIVIYINMSICKYIGAERSGFDVNDQVYGLTMTAFAQVLSSKVDNGFVVKLLETCDKYIKDARKKIVYCDALINAAKKVPGGNSVINDIADNICKFYLNEPDIAKKNFMKLVCRSENYSLYIDRIMEYIKENADISSFIGMYSSMLASGSREMEKYADQIYRLSEEKLRDYLNFHQSPDPDLLYSYYQFYKLLNDNYNVSVDGKLSFFILEQYVKVLYEKHFDFHISEKYYNQLTDLNKDLELIKKSPYYATLGAFVVVDELDKNVNVKGKNIYRKNGRSIIEYTSLPEDQKQNFLKTVAAMCAKHWVNTDDQPFFFDIFTIDSPKESSDKVYQQLLSYVVNELLSFENKKKHRYIADTIEIAIANKYDTFLETVPLAVCSKTKYNDVLKLLEKDWADKIKLKNPNDPNNILAQMDSQLFQKVVNKMQEYYKKNGSKSSLSGLLGNMFGKK